MKSTAKKSLTSCSSSSYTFSLYSLILVIALMFFTFGGFVVGYVSGAMNQRAMMKAALMQGGSGMMNLPPQNP